MRALFSLLIPPLLLGACTAGVPVERTVVVSGARFEAVQGEAAFVVRTYLPAEGNERREVVGARCKVVFEPLCDRARHARAPCRAELRPAVARNHRGVRGGRQDGHGDGHGLHPLAGTARGRGARHDGGGARLDRARTGRLGMVGGGARCSDLGLCGPRRHPARAIGAAGPAQAFAPSAALFGKLPEAPAARLGPLRGVALGELGVGRLDSAGRSSERPAPRAPCPCEARAWAGVPRRRAPGDAEPARTDGTERTAAGRGGGEEETDHGLTSLFINFDVW